MTKVQLYYFHDPMCSWCWGYRSTLLRLKNKLPADIAWRAVLGGLAADSQQPMPQAMQQMLQATWRNIEQQLGANFNHDFWRLCQPRRSTYLACRAVLAAGRQQAAEDMVLAIQQAYYLRALNPSDDEVLIQLAGELGLDKAQFASELHSAHIEQLLQDDIVIAGSWPIAGFPSLVLVRDEEKIPLTLDYQDEDVTLRHLHALLHPSQ
ncbi:DsbA family protein [Dasania marina]|uniref:DsbA family protein n=1 Tax=Dasania marina TaxID=471499 RepID=UPI0030DAEC58